MKATDARKLSKTSAKNVIITPYLEKIYAKIEEAAKLGGTAINFNPYEFVPCHVHFQSEIHAAIRAQLHKDGYVIKHYEDPDPGYPGSSDYEVISW